VNLRIPGPTPCPPQVLEAMAKQMINHRGPEFGEIVRDVTANLRAFFQTRNDLLILTASGSGGMEAAIVNTLSPGDKVLAVSIGVFGERFARIAGIYGADVTRLNFEWGKPADPDEVRRALEAEPRYKAVLVTHNETSTGVTNDLPAIAKVVKEHGKLLLVDGISSVGSIEIKTDDWGCDVVVSGSQKGWMVPPGLVFVTMSEQAWRAEAEAKMPRFYLDVAAAKRYLEKDQTPFTPAVSLFYALQVALRMMDEEGRDNVFDRHAKIAQHTREGVKALGLQLFADERFASNTITAVRVPEGVDGKQLTKVLREDKGVVVSGGQQSLEGKIFRIGHLGYVTEADIDNVMAALAEVLPRLGFRSSVGIAAKS